MKKFLASLLALTMLLSVLMIGTASAEPTEIVFWTALSGNLGETLDTIINNFNASQNDWNVVAQYQGSYYDIAAKLQTAVVAGEEPDVVQCECSRVCMFAEYGIFEELSDEAAQYGLDVDSLFDGFMADCDWGQGLYAVPFNRSTPMFYYNKTLFDGLGLKAPTTWDELHETALAVSKPGEVWGFEVPVDSWFWEAFIVQSGGSLMNENNTDIGFNNETGWAALDMLRTMVDDGSMKTPPGAEYNAWEAARSDLAAGITTMIMTSSGDLRTLMKTCDFEVGTAFLPANEKFGVVTGGANIAVLAGHEEKIAGIMSFLNYMISPETAGFWAANTGYVPISEAASQTDVYKEFLTTYPAGSTALAQMEYATNQPTIPQWTEIASEFMMDEMQRCVEDRAYTPAMATQTVSDSVKTLIASK